MFRHACKLGVEGIVSKRPGSRYRSSRSPDWVKFKNPEAPAVKQEAEENWGRRGGGDQRNPKTVQVAADLVYGPVGDGPQGRCICFRN